jgi:L-galactose dehydrogenase/L-glyceraldehyde 3-phosphate reductase
MSLKKRHFARTGLNVSEVVLGGGIVGGILILPDENVRHAALERIIAAGINWIDTAASYGNGVSEQTIGRHLPHLNPRPHISTKFIVAPEDHGDVAGAITHSLEQSLKRLRLDRVDLLQLHNHIRHEHGPRAITPEQVLRRGGVADALDGLKAQGLIGAFGLTAASDMRAVREVIDSGRFDTAQVYYNMINPSAAWDRVPPGWSADDLAGLVATCQRHGMGLMNIRVFAGGSLASPQRHGREFVMFPGADLDSEEKRAAAVRHALGHTYGTPAQAALRFALARTDFACHVAGIADLAQLDEALAAVRLGPLPPDALTKLEPVWASNFGMG